MTATSRHRADRGEPRGREPAPPERPHVQVHLGGGTDAGDAYEVTARADYRDLKAEGRFRPADLPDDVIHAAVAAMDRGRLDAEATRRLGARLFGALITGEVAELYDKVRLDRPAIRLVVDPPEARRVPWELMHDGSDFVALAFPFSRGISSVKEAEPLTARLPLRVLIVDSIPAGAAGLSSEAEIAGIESELRELGESAEVTSMSAATLRDVDNALREAAKRDGRPFHVLHFIGHGLHSEKTGKSSLLFRKDATGTPQAVSPEHFAKLVAPYGLKLVFLNSCESAFNSAHGSAGNFAPALLEEGVPAVIGMQTSVFDRAARRFAVEFYGAMADNLPIDAALANARRVVNVSAPGRPAQMGVPVLYLSSETGRILDLRPPPLWKRPPVVVAALLALVAGVASVVGLVLPGLGGPGAMNEFTFNVAVAEFAAGDGVDATTAEDLAGIAFDLLEGELSGLDFPTDLWDPSRTGAIDGAADAERRAGEINADLVVYGSVVAATSGVEYQPEFLLGSRRLPEATELAGPYRLGTPERVDPASLASTQRLVQRLGGRTAALARFVMGLSLYADRDYEAASDWFESAETNTAWEDDQGREILHLFLGNAHGRLQEWRQAGAAYEESLRITDDAYARAWIGLAGVTYQQSRGDCLTPASPAGLGTAAEQYGRALRAESPPLADIGAKAAFGLGRVYLCQALAGLEPYGDPVAEYEAVIGEFEAGNGRIAEFAREAHADLGAYYAGVVADYRRAIAEYRRAIDLTPDAGRQAVYSVNLAETLARSGDCPGSREAYEEAIRLTDDARLVAHAEAALAALGC